MVTRNLPRSPRRALIAPIGDGKQQPEIGGGAERDGDAEAHDESSRSSGAPLRRVIQAMSATITIHTACR
ncbi:hypothetical protein D3C83_117670 [compost metagenome]